MLYSKSILLQGRTCELNVHRLQPAKEKPDGSSLQRIHVEYCPTSSGQIHWLANPIRVLASFNIILWVGTRSRVDVVL